MARKRVLFVTYGGGHVTIAIPLYRALIASGKYDCTILALTTAGAALRREGIPFLSYRDLVDPARDARALGIGRALLQGNTHPDVPDEESVAYLGLSYVDLEDRLGSEEARRVYAEKGRYSFVQIGPLERAFERVRPDLVISTNVPRSERAAIIVGRGRGARTISIIDLFATDPSIEWIVRPDFSDKVCVLSDAVKGKLTELGCDPSRIEVTGNPAFDRLADPTLPAKAAAFRSANGWGGKRVILWASVGGEESREIERKLTSLLERHPDWHLVLRFRPSEAVPEVTPAPHLSVSTPQDDLPTALMACDAVVTCDSTVGLEGALIGKPLLSVVAPGYCTNRLYVDMGIGLGAFSLDEIEPQLIRCLEQGRAALPPLVKPGTATANVASVIRGLIG